MGESTWEEHIENLADPKAVLKEIMRKVINTNTSWQTMESIDRNSPEDIRNGAVLYLTREIAQILDKAPKGGT